MFVAVIFYIYFGHPDAFFIDSSTLLPSLPGRIPKINPLRRKGETRTRRGCCFVTGHPICRIWLFLSSTTIIAYYR